jgi:HD-GYP domain-containing protein (c-di-GMP phosphodiesterase class II)
MLDFEIKISILNSMKKMIPTLRLEVGMYLCTNIYDQKGVLLISKDRKIESELQLRRIIQADNHYTFIDTDKGKDVDHNVLYKNFDEMNLYSHSYEVKELIDFAKEFDNAKNLYSNMTKKTEKIFESIMNGNSKVTLPIVLSFIENIIRSIDRSNQALFTIAKTRPTSSYLLSHSVNVAIIAVLLGKFLEYPKEWIIDLCIAAFFHDIGMLEIPAEIYDKPDKLDGSEWIEMKRHPEYSFKIANNIPGFPKRALIAILQHHERADGSGYPKGILSEKISESSRIIAITDVFDALTSRKIYRDELAIHEGLSTLFRIVELRSPLMEKFVTLLGVYPIGTFVKLTTGELGIVISVNHDSLLRPKVGIVFDKDRVKRKSLYEFIDLSIHEKECAVERTLDPKIWEIDVADYLGKLVPEELNL